MRFGRVEITGGFLLLLAWLNYLDRSFLVPAAILACTAHELGHIFVIKAFGWDIKCIHITAVGAEIVLARQMGYWQEGVSALAGPAVNLVLALICCGFKNGLAFAGLNLILAVFNLLPVGRLDGGKVLYCVLALLAGPVFALRVSGWLDCLCMVGSLVIGLWLLISCGNVTLLLVALWLLAAFWKSLEKNRNYTCQKGWKKVQ